MKKGISLPVETTVIIVIAVIVLVALLLFFSGTVNPGIDRIKLESQKADLCSKYVTADKECLGAPSGESAKLKDVCKNLGTTNIRTCCSIYCPQIKTKEQCAAAGADARCIGVPCSQATIYTVELGQCTDDSALPYCCTKPA